MTFFEPACGCGNFFAIAYRELRLLEMEVIRDIRDATVATTQTVLGAEWPSVVDVGQLYRIELDEFPAHIAAIAMRMIDDIMSNRLKLEFGRTYTRIPRDYHMGQNVVKWTPFILQET